MTCAGVEARTDRIGATAATMAPRAKATVRAKKERRRPRWGVKTTARGRFSYVAMGTAPEVAQLTASLFRSDRRTVEPQVSNRPQRFWEHRFVRGARSVRGSVRWGRGRAGRWRRRHTVSRLGGDRG